jgi:ABC-type glutathione transport system ATPase component
MPSNSNQVILRAEKVGKSYFTGMGLFGRAQKTVAALSDVSLSIRAGTTMALVGESGSGKTTLGRCIVGLHEPTEGRVFYRDRELSRRVFRRDLGVRKAIQMIFQDPAASLNPRQRVGAIIAEPLIVHRIAEGESARKRVTELLDAVGLGAGAAGKYPHEFSGGQKQRIAIARALSLEPEVLVCDEAVSALDVSVQAQIVNLLRDLQKERGLTYLFISHDMAVVRHIADEVAVMRAGRIVELAPTGELFSNPATDYSSALLAAVPRGISMHRQAA